MNQDKGASGSAYGSGGNVFNFPNRAIATDSDWNTKLRVTATSGGGGNGGDDMDGKIAKLESDVENIKSNFGDIKQDLRFIRDEGAKEIDLREAKSGLNSLWRFGLAGISFVLVAFAYGFMTLNSTDNGMQSSISDVRATTARIDERTIWMQRQNNSHYGQVIQKLDELTQATPAMPHLGHDNP